MSTKCVVYYHSPYQENTGTNSRYEMMNDPPAFDSSYTHADRQAPV